MVTDTPEISAIESCDDKSSHDMSEMFGHLDHHDYSPFLRCLTPVNTNSFDENSEVSDMQINLHISMISNSSLSSMSIVSPSKVVVQEQCDIVQLERKQAESSNLQLSVDVPLLPVPELYGYSTIGDNIDKNVSPRK